MIRVARWLLAVPLIILLCGPKAHAQIINAASCSSAAVQTALNSVAADGTVVDIPSCPSGVAWTTQVTYRGKFSFSLFGAGSLTTVGGGDQTVIQDSITGGSSPYMLQIGVAPGKTFRMAAISFTSGARSTVDDGSVQISCNDTPGELRIDHVHFSNVSTALGVSDCFGVMDHSITTEGAGNGNWSHFHFGNYNNGAAANQGSGSWAAPTAFGSANFLFFEDNTFDNGTDDCTKGGRLVFRHNTFVNGSSVQTHPTGGNGPDNRGCRAYEVYQNSFSATVANNAFNVWFMSSGTGLFWGNTISPNYSHFITLHSMRRNNNTYPETATPSGWGYCGTSFNGTGSAWDQNSNSSTGYACIDQPGRGKGDLITGLAPNWVNSATGTISWPRQAIEPVYEWMNTGWSGSTTFYATAFDGGYAQNQDYYLWCNPSSSSGCTGFNGTAGTGSGLLSARPSTCTPNPVAYPAGNSPGVGYWATDTNTFYVCTSTNTWTAYYTPYTYPHPLTFGSSAGPNSPSNLQVVVQ
jgi:hypothetical protein